MEPTNPHLTQSRKDHKVGRATKQMTYSFPWCSLCLCVTIVLCTAQTGMTSIFTIRFPMPSNRRTKLYLSQSHKDHEVKKGTRLIPSFCFPLRLCVIIVLFSSTFGSLLLLYLKAVILYDCIGKELLTHLA